MTIVPRFRGPNSVTALWLVVDLALAAMLHGQSILVKPYIQPGDGSALGSADVKVVAWMTDHTPGDFTVTYGEAGKPTRQTRPTPTKLQIDADRQFLTYAATLSDLPLNSHVHYEVELCGKAVGDGTFATRKTPDRNLRFLVVGDTGAGTPSQRALAHHMNEARPEFALICGDVVYLRGLVSEYMAKFWPVYCDPDRSDPGMGAPLMRSVPFYAGLGNHDTGVGMDLTANPDGGGAFYFFHPPRNGPGAGTWVTPMRGTPDQLQRFHAAADQAGYPYLSFYSFDNGPAHFLMLDTDAYMPVNDATLRDWIRRDLANSHAHWKFVFMHHPPFQSSATHWNDQRTRLLVPLFEETGVDVVFAGHVHNYQRSKPLQFTASNPRPANATGPVRGTFKIDESFDGARHTRADGIIYIVTGAGGAGLYPMGPKNAPQSQTPDPDAPGGLTMKAVADRRSFSLVELEPEKFVMRQIDEQGKEIDQFTLAKPAR